MAKKLINTDIKLGEGTLLLEALADILVDFPVEQGTNYIKWNSGKVEMWGYASITPVAGTPTYTTVALPVEVTGYSTSDNFFVTLGLNSTVAGTTVLGYGFAPVDTISMRVYVTRTNTTATIVNWYVIGKWK